MWAQCVGTPCIMDLINPSYQARESLHFIYWLLYWRIGPHYKSAVQCLGVSRAVTPRTRGRGHWDTERQNYLLQSSLEADSRSAGPGSCSQSLDVSCRHLPALPLMGGYSSIFSSFYIDHISSISSNFPQLSAATLVIPWVIIPKIVKEKRMFGKNIHPCFHRDIYLVRCTQFSFIRYRNVGKRFVYFQDTAFIKFFSRRKVKL